MSRSKAAGTLRVSMSRFNTITYRAFPATIPTDIRFMPSVSIVERRINGLGEVRVLQIWGTTAVLWDSYS